MAKKDTYLALLRRGIDENTAHLLSDSGVKVGDIKKFDVETLSNNYGLKKEVAESVLDAIRSGPRDSSKQRFLADVLADRTKKKIDTIEERRFKREQKDLHSELLEKKEQLRIARVEQFRNKKLVMNRLGKTIELIVKLENSFDDESKDEQRSKLRDQLETRGLEAARDHEMLELVGTPQDIVDFRRKIAPKICMHACPSCGEEIDPIQGNVMEDMTDFSLICWECEEEFRAPMAQLVEDRLNNGSRIKIDSKKKPRLTVKRVPKKKIFETRYRRGSERKDRMQTKVGSIDSITAHIKATTCESDSRIFLEPSDLFFKNFLSNPSVTLKTLSRGPFYVKMPHRLNPITS